MKSFLCFLLLIAASTALPSDADSWIEAETSSSAHIEAQAKMESLLQAEMQTRAAEASTKLQEHLESITMNDIRDAVTSTAHETGLIHYKFAQVEIEQQAKTVETVIKLIKELLAKTVDLLVQAADIAGAFIADAVKPTIDKVVAKLTPEVIQQGNEAIFAAATGLAELLEMALLGGITDFLIFMVAVNPLTTPIATTMIAIDSAGATVAALAQVTAAKESGIAAAKDFFGPAFDKLGVQINGDANREKAQLATELANSAEKANLRLNLIKALKAADLVTPVFCAHAKMMAKYILGPPAAKGAAAPAPAPAPAPGLTPAPMPAAGVMVTIKGWGLSIGNSIANAANKMKEDLEVLSGKSILFVENYLPRCIEAREAYCLTMVAKFKRAYTKDALTEMKNTQCNKDKAPAKPDSLAVYPKPLVTLNSACLSPECPRVP